jgi:hypothetical protein
VLFIKESITEGWNGGAAKVPSSKLSKEMA